MKPNLWSINFYRCFLFYLDMLWIIYAVVIPLFSFTHSSLFIKDSKNKSESKPKISTSVNGGKRYLFIFSISNDKYIPNIATFYSTYTFVFNQIAIIQLKAFFAHIIWLGSLEKKDGQFLSCLIKWKQILINKTTEAILSNFIIQSKKEGKNNVKT